ncbi:5'-3' exonuclease [Ureaplasma miroungigenitalium]|uniref:5'-3' exonuclease n=1 Tax=Ureaplasma miroungigenitalium TaxID=1042321 RepID=A0ABT3BMZ3_9BACT|nr:5'-3' exonuclease [Ureaplasma miroungigenitalium]MCV3728599.1 5'-3' exonuclease [Ureaplasma miroungigenitalium]
MSKKAFVLDASALIYRAYFASYKQLEYNKAHNVPPNNAIKLVGKMLKNIMQFDAYDYALVALDSPHQTLRKDVYSDYKKDRKPMDQELVDQLEPIKELFHILGLKTFVYPGYEADDIVGSFARFCNEKNIHVDVFSSDKDLLQLVNELTQVHLFKTGVSVLQTNNIANFAEQNNDLLPLQIIDFKALAGDSSDNLTGVRGIGKQTALNLILNFDSLDNIYNNLDKCSNSIQTKLINDKENAYLCYELAKIKTDLLETAVLDDFVVKQIDDDALSDFLMRWKINLSF